MQPNTAFYPDPPPRKPLQGVRQIIAFNWHFYALAIGLMGVLVIFGGPVGAILSGLMAIPMVISLVISWYVYDASSLYQFRWLNSMRVPESGMLLNIHAGFDETSAILHAHYPVRALQVMDFYHPERHAEVSIRRARRARKQYPGTVSVDPQALPAADGSVAAAFVIFAAHEIREPGERVAFLSELRRVLADGGQIAVVEHLRDGANFFAYTVGFFHFMALSQWKRDFQQAQLNLVAHRKLNPFVSLFILEKWNYSSK